MLWTICGVNVTVPFARQTHSLENYLEPRRHMERFQWNDKYEEDIEGANMYREELRVLRALFFFELAKRYGDIPLLTRTL